MGQGGKIMARREHKRGFLFRGLEKWACYIVESQQVAQVQYLSYTSIKYSDKKKKNYWALQLDISYLQNKTCFLICYVVTLFVHYILKPIIGYII